MQPRQLIIPKISPDIPVSVLGDERIISNALVCIVSDLAPREELAAYRIGYVLGSEGYTLLSGAQNETECAAVKGCIEGYGKPVIVIPCPLSAAISSNLKDLVRQVLTSGGCVFTPYKTFKPSFLVQQTHLMARISESLVVIHAEIGGPAEKAIETAYQRRIPRAILRRAVTPDIAEKYYMLPFYNKRSLLTAVQGRPEPVDGV